MEFKEEKVFERTIGTKRAFKIRRKGEEIELSDYYEFEERLDELKDFLNTKTISIHNGDEDGRVVSLQEESKITDLLNAEFDFVKPKAKNRDQGDCYIKTKCFLFPVNVKLIGDSNDSYNNLCGKAVTISQLLYGCGIASHKKLAKKLCQPFTTTPQQYGVLAVNKANGFTKACTLFNINKIFVNPSNGFQFNFNTLDTVPRTQEQGQQFIKNKYMQLIRAQAIPWEICKSHADKNILF